MNMPNGLLRTTAVQTAATLAAVKNDPIAQAWATILQQLVLKSDGDPRQVIAAIRAKAGWDVRARGAIG